MKRVARILALPMALSLATSLSVFAQLAPPSPGCPPKTPKLPVTDTYQGVKVTDEYRWLENGSDIKVKAWSSAQNECARLYLDKLPGRDLLAARFATLLGGASPSFYSLTIEGGTLFAMKDQPPKQQPFLVTLPLDAPDAARPVLDPGVLDPRGITAIDWFVPSPDGKLVAVSLSVGGSEDGTLQIIDVATGKPVHEKIVRVQEGTGGGSLAWDKDGTGFFYTRYPRGSERPPEDLNFYQQIYHHVLGTPDSKDEYALGRDFPKIAETELKRSEDGTAILAAVANGDGGEHAFFLLGPSGKWARVADFKDQVKAAEFGPGGSLYCLSIKDAPRGKVLRLSVAEPDLAKARVVVPESDAVLEGLRPTASRLYVREMAGGPSRIRIFGLEGKSLGEVPLPPETSVGELVCAGVDDLLFDVEGYLKPPAWVRFIAHTGTLSKTALVQTSPADFSDTEVISTQAVSKDGTKIPLVILMRKGTPLSGNNPALLTGYGGFGISQTPTFRAARRVWIEQGGIYAIASLRGGGEFGEAWHEAGKLTRKQNVFDDFAACARTLLEKGYTKPARLAILGGSNGGLLMGAELVQHPELFRTVVSYAGIYDMLRVELSTNGAFNVTEYGAVKDPEQFKALYAYSPYLGVTDKTSYPPALFLTGANDPRVDPMQSRKFVARLQVASVSGAPVLLRTSSSSGHGLDMALAERIAENVDVYSFLLHQVGVTVHGPGGKKG
jgi:prolyl oligopeptidase